MKTPQAIEQWLTDYLAKALEIGRDEIDPTVSLAEYGIDSTAAVGLSGDLSRWLGVELKDSVAFDYPTIAELSEHASSLQTT
jgi:acyl carrier protein